MKQSSLCHSGGKKHTYMHIQSRKERKFPFWWGIVRKNLLFLKEHEQRLFRVFHSKIRLFRIHLFLWFTDNESNGRKIRLIVCKEWQSYYSANMTAGTFFMQENWCHLLFFNNMLTLSVTNIVQRLWGNFIPQLFPPIQEYCFPDQSIPLSALSSLSPLFLRI